MNAPCIPDVALRIGVQDQQIGALAGFDSAELGCAPHGAGTTQRGGLEDRQRGKPGLGHAFHLSVQRGAVQGTDVDAYPLYTPEPGGQEGYGAPCCTAR